MAKCEFFVSGQFAGVGSNNTDDISNRTNFGFSPFDAFTTRIFLDASVTNRLSGFVQFYVGGSEYSVFPYAAYLRYDHTPKVHLEAGLIPTPIGLWGVRTYPDKNPLIGTPAIYQYKTSLDTRGELQPDAAEILEDRGTGNYAPILYDFCWNTGIHGYASFDIFDFGIAVTNGSLGSPKRQVTYARPNVVMHVSVIPAPCITVGAWVSAGPYLSPGLESTLPDGDQVEDYNQLTAGGLIHTSWGHWDVYAEAIVNRFEHPYLGDLENFGGYADAKVKFATWWFAAGRIDILSFSKLSDPESDGERWDYPIYRFEGGVGRQLSERSRIKAVIQIIRYMDAPKELDHEIVGAQLSTEL